MIAIRQSITSAHFYFQVLPSNPIVKKTKACLNFLFDIRTSSLDKLFTFSGTNLILVI